LNPVTLIDGAVVDSSGPAWRAECLTRYKQVQTLLSMRGQGSLAMRQGYLRTVEAVDGAQARLRLEAAFTAAWAAALAQQQEGAAS